MKKKPGTPKPIPLIASLSASSGPSLVRHLASCNASVRLETFKLIQSWLSGAQTQLSDDEMTRIWKGIFYCLGQSNKPSAEAQLINMVSSLLLILNPSLSLQYFSVFLVTVRRQLNGVNHLMLDNLIRKFVNGMFCLMMKCKWDLEYLGEFTDALEKKAFLVEDKVRGSGVNNQVVSVFLDEMKGFPVPLGRKEVVDCLFRPFFGVLERSSDKVLLGKVKSCVFYVLLKMGRGLLEREMCGTDDGVGEKGERLLGIIALKMGFCAKLYEAGSGANCIQGNKEVVLDLHDEFLMLEKELETSGIDIHIPEVHEADYDVLEIPELIPFKYDEGTKLGLIQDVTEEGSLQNQRKKAKAGKLSDKKTKSMKTLKDVLMDNGASVEEHRSVVISISANEIPELIPFKYDEGTKLGLIGDVTEERSLRLQKKRRKKKAGKLSHKKTKSKKTLKDVFMDNGASVEEHGSVVISNSSANEKVIIDNNLETGNSCATSAVAKEILDTPTNFLSRSALDILGNELDFGKDVTSNLQAHFEEASQMNLGENELPLLSLRKNRTRAESANGYDILEGNNQLDDEVDAGVKSPEKKVKKKVIFDMNNNLTWMTHNPLPSQNLRIPPSAIPRGSALKKGVPPGPIIEVTTSPKKVALKKGRKIAKTISPAPKRLRRVHVVSVT